MKGGWGGVNRDLKFDPFLLLTFLVFVLVMIFQYKDIIIHAIQHKAYNIKQAEVIQISHKGLWQILYLFFKSL